MYLCVYVLWPSRVGLATGPVIGWDGTKIIFRKKLYVLKINFLIIILLLLFIKSFVFSFVVC